MRTQTFRAFSAGELIDRALRLYQRRGSLILSGTLGASLATLASAAFVFGEVIPRLFTTRNPDDIMVQLGETLVTLVLGLFVGGPLFLLGLASATLVVVMITSADYLGETVDLPRIEQAARKRLPATFALCARQLLVSSSGILFSALLTVSGGLIADKAGNSAWLGGLAVVLGILGLVAGFAVFFILLARGSLAYPAMILEDLPHRAAHRRGLELLKHHPKHGNGFGIMLSAAVLIAVLLLVLSTGISVCFQGLPFLSGIVPFLKTLPFGELWATAFELIPDLLVVWLIVPIWATVVTLVYYDRRTRLEGFDIGKLAEELGRARKNRFDV